MTFIRLGIYCIDFLFTIGRDSGSGRHHCSNAIDDVPSTHYLKGRTFAL